MQVFCPLHKTVFDVPAQPQIVCAIVEHSLSHDFARTEFWEYCCNCQTYWPSELGKGGPAANSCPVCQRELARRYVCHDCRLVSAESNESAKGQTHHIIEGGISPSCPACGKAAQGNISAHYCGEAQARVNSIREVCPFCNATIGQPSTIAALTVSPPVGPACRECGMAKDDAEALFCTNCGCQFAASGSVPTELGLTNAGRQSKAVPEDLAHSLFTPSITLTQEPVSPRKSLRVLWGVLAVVAGLAVVGVAVKYNAQSTNRSYSSNDIAIASQPTPLSQPSPTSPPEDPGSGVEYQECVLWNDVGGFTRVNVRRNCDAGNCAEAGRYPDNTSVQATEERVTRSVQGKLFTFRKIYINDVEFWVAEKKLHCN